jgi:glycerol uptake facilitator-like aquaporin
MINNQVLTEFFGTALLLAVVTGSGIMGESLAAGNAAVALLGNSIATGCGLYVLISLLGPISGAHFNPVVSLMFWRMGALEVRTLYAYVCAQFSGAIAGVWLTHLIFGLPIMQQADNARTGVGIWASELVSTLILLSVIYLGVQYAKDKIAMLVALTVTGGYWFTSSTFFANPAVTVARSLSNTFVGIAPAHVLGFVAAQLLAVMLVFIYINCLIISKSQNPHSD